MKSYTQKPIASLELIVEHIIKHANYESVTIAEENFRLQREKYLYFVTSGNFTLRNQTNNHINFVDSAPFIVGIVNNKDFTDGGMVFSPQSECTVLIMDRQEADNIFSEKGFWKILYLFTTYVIQSMLITKNMTHGANSYKKIKNCIESLQQLPDDVKSKISAIQFIINETGISRSRVSAILAELKKGGFIKVTRGKLISVDKSLPHDY
ncbi:helix-turn-helix domain-containing protein [Pseudocitrobacter cyperus]|uniref:Helix-turn-helix domain-containing protein n=1 Tax=Pseudocitrobacter cyperus TaxID=3112843 RepID=A0ABV0HGQ0_9ENTR